MPTIPADPYAWPFDGDLTPQNTALIIIDMQTDFCGKGGYVDKMGYDLSLTRAPIEPIRARARARCAPRAITSSTPARAIAPICRDLPANKRWRSRRIGAGIGDPGPVRPHPGARRARLGDHSRTRAEPGEPIIDKPGKGSFCATDLELMLRTTRHPQHHPDRHHHRRLRPHDHARGQRPRLRVPAARGLLRRDRPRQPPRRDQDDQDAGRRVRRGLGLESIPGASAVSVAERPRPSASRNTRDLARNGGHDQALRPAGRARRRLDQGRGRRRFMRCWARTAPASRRSSNASWAFTRPIRATSCSTAKRS